MTVTVDAVVYYRIQDPVMSVNNIANPHHSTKLLAQTTLRNVLGQKSLQEMLTDREGISELMQVTYHTVWCTCAHMYTRRVSVICKWAETIPAQVLLRIL